MYSKWWRIALTTATVTSPATADPSLPGHEDMRVRSMVTVPGRSASDVGDERDDGMRWATRREI